MQPRQKVVLLLSAVFAGIAGLLAWKYLSQNAVHTARKLHTVYVAARPLQSHATVTVAMVEGVTKEGDIEPGAISSLDQIKGGIALTNVPTGATITTSNVGVPHDLPLTTRMKPGQRAVTISIDPVRGVANLIQPGDHVDVIAIQRGRGGSGADAKAQTIMHGVDVLAMGKDIDGNSDPSTNGTDATTVTLAMSDKDAEQISLADSTATLRLTLRAAKEKSPKVTTEKYILVTPPPQPQQAAPQRVTQDAQPKATAAAKPQIRRMDITVIDGDHILGDH